MKRVLYFAYGSNMNRYRIEARLRNAKNAGTYKLYGYKLIFNAQSFVAPHNYANIIKSTPEDFVEGVLYDITAHQFKILDGYEQLYDRYFFEINANTLGCVYICTDEFNISQKYIPDELYMNVCIQGARQNNLDHTAALLLNLKEQINFNRKVRPKNFYNY